MRIKEMGTGTEPDFLTMEGQSWIGINHIKILCCEWGQLTVSVAFYSRLYRKMCINIIFLKTNGGQLTPLTLTPSASLCLLLG